MSCKTKEKRERERESFFVVVLFNHINHEIRFHINIIEIYIYV